MSDIVRPFAVLLGVSALAILSGCVDSEVVSSTGTEVGEEIGVTDETSESDGETEHGGHHYVEVDNSNFEEIVLNSDKPVLVDFWAPWCGPCLAIGPTIEELAKEYEGKAVVAKINVDEASELAQKYEITSIPNLLYFYKGERVDGLIGAGDKSEIEAKLAALLPGAAAE